jgi:hypothetical protein
MSCPKNQERQISLILQVWSLRKWVLISRKHINFLKKNEEILENHRHDEKKGVKWILDNHNFRKGFGNIKVNLFTLWVRSVGSESESGFPCFNQETCFRTTTGSQGHIFLPLSSDSLRKEPIEVSIIFSEQFRSQRFEHKYRYSSIYDGITLQ